MGFEIPSVFRVLPKKEKILSLIVLLCVWGGIGIALLLFVLGIIGDPGRFYWGCIIGSFVLSYLALQKKKKDLVSMLTPAYAVIIFMGLDIEPNLMLQTLFATTVTVLVIRLHLRYSNK